jgi:hypothetical protein
LVSLPFAGRITRLVEVLVVLNRTPGGWLRLVELSVCGTKHVPVGFIGHSAKDSGFGFIRLRPCLTALFARLMKIMFDLVNAILNGLFGRRGDDGPQGHEEDQPAAKRPSHRQSM